MLVPRSLLGSIDQAEILPGFRSDHSIIMINVVLNEINGGPGLWKFNTTLLENEGFVDKLKIVIDESISESNNKELPLDQTSELVKYVIAK